MNRKVLLAGAAVAAIAAAGGATVAVAEPSSHTPGSPASGSSRIQQQRHRHGRLAAHRLLRHLTHGQVVLRNRHGEDVTVDLIRGAVTSVSPSSITVQAADHTSFHYTVLPTTHVRHRSLGAHGTGTGRGTSVSIKQVRPGDTVMVVGTGTSAKTARRIVDLR